MQPDKKEAKDELDSLLDDYLGSERPPIISPAAKRKKVEEELDILVRGLSQLEPTLHFQSAGAEAEKVASSAVVAPPQPSVVTPASYTPRVLGPQGFVELYTEIKTMCTSSGDMSRLPEKWDEMQRICGELVDSFTFGAIQAYKEFLQVEKLIDPKKYPMDIINPEDGGLYVSKLMNQITSWATDLFLAAGDSLAFRSLLLTSMIDMAYKAAFENHDHYSGYALFAAMNTATVSRLTEGIVLPEEVQTRYNELKEIYNTPHVPSSRKLREKVAHALPIGGIVTYDLWYMGEGIDTLSENTRQSELSFVESLGSRLDRAEAVHKDKKHGSLDFLEEYPIDNVELDKKQVAYSYTIKPSGREQEKISKNLKKLPLIYAIVNQAIGEAKYIGKSAAINDNEVSQALAKALLTGDKSKVITVLKKYGFEPTAVDKMADDLPVSYTHLRRRRWSCVVV